MLMVGITSIKVKERLAARSKQLGQAETPTVKERWQGFYWLKQDTAPSIRTIAKALGKHRLAVQRGAMYREGGVETMLEIKQSPGGVRVIPQWAEAALAKQLQEANHRFSS